MTNIKFKKFYFIDDHQLHNLLDVQHEYENNNGDISKYRGKMFCSECKQAKLSFTHKTSNKQAFLSKIPSSNHKDTCSLMNEYASKKEIKEFFEKLNNKEIQDKLESVLNLLLPKENEEYISEKNDFENNLFIIIELKNKNNIRKLIHKKSMNSSFFGCEEGLIYIFYGRVKLEIEEVLTKKYGICFQLNVKIKKENN